MGVAMVDEQKQPLWRRAWSVISTLDTLKDVGGMLLSLGGGAAAASRVSPTGKLWELNVHQALVTVSVFGFGSFAALSLWNVGWMAAPKFVRVWRRRFGETPQLIVTPRGGRAAVLEVENTGGVGALTAWGRIISVSAGFPFKRRDRFPMLWRSHWKNVMLAAPQGAVLRKGSPALVMWIAEHDMIVSGTIGGQATVMAICGGSGRVDAIHIDPKHGSPSVVIEIEIISEPPLDVPFVRYYKAEIKSGYKTEVELEEVTR
jgi:hypothetical protein